MRGTLIPLDPLIPLSGILSPQAARECRTVRFVCEGYNSVEPFRGRIVVGL
jgi:hypothetical protein